MIGPFIHPGVPKTSGNLKFALQWGGLYDTGVGIMPSVIVINLTDQFGVKQTSLVFLPYLVVGSKRYFDPSRPKARGELAVGCNMVSLNDSGVRVMPKRSVMMLVVQFGNKKMGLVFWVTCSNYLEKIAPPPKGQNRLRNGREIGDSVGSKNYQTNR